jgi:hypothetical protein
MGGRKIVHGEKSSPQTDMPYTLIRVTNEDGQWNAEVGFSENGRSFEHPASVAALLGIAPNDATIFDGGVLFPAIGAFIRDALANGDPYGNFDILENYIANNALRALKYIRGGLEAIYTIDYGPIDADKIENDLGTADILTPNREPTVFVTPSGDFSDLIPTPIRFSLRPPT